MKIFHIKASDCTFEMERRFADLVCAFATLGISQQILMTADKDLEILFSKLDIPFYIQKFGGLFDLRTLHAARQIIDSYRPHIIQTHSPDSASAISKINHDSIRIGFIHENDEPNKKNEALNDLLLATSYLYDGEPLNYNILPVPPLVLNKADYATPVSRAQFNTPEKAPLIGTMIDLEEFYDIAPLFQTIREMPQLHFWIVGKGAAQKQLEERARKLAIHDRVTFIEDTSRWPELLKALDICVVPYRHKGADRLTLEAWSCGVCVASAAKADQSPITHKDDGWLVEAHDPSGWTLTVKTLLEDEEQRRSLAATGLQRYRQSFNPGRLIGRYLQSYETALKIKV